MSDPTPFPHARPLPAGRVTVLRGGRFVPYTPPPPEPKPAVRVYGAFDYGDNPVCPTFEFEPRRRSKIVKAPELRWVK